MLYLLSCPIVDEEDFSLLKKLGVDTEKIPANGLNNMLLLNAVLLERAKKGELSAIKEVRAVIGEDFFSGSKLKLDQEKFNADKNKNKEEFEQQIDLLDQIVGRMGKN